SSTGVDDPAHDVRRAHAPVAAGRRRGASALPQRGAEDRHPALRARVRGAELRADGHLVRRVVRGRRRVQGSRGRNREARGTPQERAEVMAKRTGLGRGIGALIPTSSETRERPTDVFFAGSAVPEPAAAPAAEPEAPAAPARKASAKAASKPAAAKSTASKTTTSKAAASKTTASKAKTAAKSGSAKTAPARKSVPSPV